MHRPALDFDEWALTVDALCRFHLACGWRDLSGDSAPLEMGFAAGVGATEFVRWFAERHVLEWREFCETP